MESRRVLEVTLVDNIDLMEIYLNEGNFLGGLEIAVCISDKSTSSSEDLNISHRESNIIEGDKINMDGRHGMVEDLTKNEVIDRFKDTLLKLAEGYLKSFISHNTTTPRPDITQSVIANQPTISKFLSPKISF